MTNNFPLITSLLSTLIAASGNLATEDLVYLLDGLGVNTGVDLEQVVKAGEEVTEFLKIETRSKVGGAIKRKWIKEANNVE